MKRKRKMLDHAKRRLLERYSYPDAYKVMKEVENKNIQYAKRLTTNRSLIYLKVPEHNLPIKAVYQRKTKKIITILSMDLDYEIITQINYKENLYNLKFYPDCFYSTKNAVVLTEFTIFKNNEYIECSKRENLFNEIYYLAWREYLKGINENEKQEKANEALSFFKRNERGYLEIST